MARHLRILRRDLTATGTGRGALPPPAEGEPAPAPTGPLTDWARLLRRVRVRRFVRVGAAPDRLRIAPRTVRLARLAKCVPGECPSAAELPGCPRAKCLAKGCGCDDLHAVRADAVCPRGRWAA